LKTELKVGLPVISWFPRQRQQIEGVKAVRRSLRIVILVVTVLGLAVPGAGSLFAQEGELLELRLRRNFGYSLGAQMQGTFTLRVSGPADLERVEFLLDGQVIGEDTEAPFEFGFNTRDHAEGLHELSAIGYTAGGEQLRSSSIGRQFVTTNTVTVIVLAIVVLVVAFRLGSYLLARRASGGQGGRVDYGFLGGAVCPNCGQPFGVHWWSLRLGLSRFDRCPHCRKWNLVQRASREALEAAEQTPGADADDKTTDEAGREEEAKRRRLEESRFDGS
jgi:hypothetical protein